MKSILHMQLQYHSPWGLELSWRVIVTGISNGSCVKVLTAFICWPSPIWPSSFLPTPNILPLSLWWLDLTWSCQNIPDFVSNNEWCSPALISVISSFSNPLKGNGSKKSLSSGWSPIPSCPLMIFESFS